MREFLEALAEHPIASIFLGFFILAVLSSIEDIVRAARSKKKD